MGKFTQNRALGVKRALLKHLFDTFPYLGLFVDDLRTPIICFVQWCERMYVISFTRCKSEWRNPH